MRRGLQLLGLLLLLAALLRLHEALGLTPRGAQTLAAGILILAAYLAGEVAARLRQPRITGYLLLGMAIGPSMPSLFGARPWMLTASMVESLRPINGVAISLIALSAGMEINFHALRGRAKTLLGVAVGTVTVPMVLSFLGMLVLAPHIQFLAGESWALVLTASLVFASIAMANSPAVAIAVINECRAKGPVAEIALGVTVIKDIVVILVFAVVLATAEVVLHAEGSFDLTFLRDLAVEVLGSALTGMALGWLLSRVIGGLRRESPLVVLGLAIFIAEASLAFHLEPLLVSLVAGLFVENLSARDAEPLLRGIESSSFPVYALFFAHAGASLDLSALVRLWPVVVVLVPLRGAGMWAGARYGARWAGSEEVVQRYVWMAFVAQAGVSLALSVLVAQAFPGWGEGVKVVVVAMIAVQQVIGPPGLRYALDRAGEIEGRDRPS